jgi:hypothetical protein
VVADVAEVPLVFVAETRQFGDSAHQSCERVALRADRLPHTDEQALHLEDVLQLLVVGLAEDRVLQLVDSIVEGGEDREEAVDKPIDDSVEQQRRLLFASLVAAADLGEGGTVVVMDGDQRPLGVEASTSTCRSSSGAAP